MADCTLEGHGIPMRYNPLNHGPEEASYYVVAQAYDRIFGDRVTDIQYRSAAVEYATPFPPIFNDSSKDEVSFAAARYYDEAVAISSMKKDDFIDRVMERYEVDKKSFIENRNERYLAFLHRIPQSLIEGYLMTKKAEE